jgi:hypothetical protein
MLSWDSEEQELVIVTTEVETWLRAREECLVSDQSVRNGSNRISNVML